MSAVLQLSAARTPARAAEAHAIESIRRDCLAAGLQPAQVQRVLARARENLRAGHPPRASLQALLARAEALGPPSPTLLDALQVALRELLAGRSPAVAYQAGVAEMKAQMPARAPEGGAA